MGKEKKDAPTRLERLFGLLESGSTDAVRKAAAEQIAEVVKLHPHELNQLLFKIRNYLHSSEWETRVAAGHAVEAIAAIVPRWKPEWRVKEEQEEDEEEEEAPLLNYEVFDVETVIAKGQPLLACEGKEYELDNSSFSSQQRVKEQRKILMKRLGLDERVKISGSESWVKDEDILFSNSNKQENLLSKTTQAVDVLSKIESDVTLSAREKNRLKRIAKQSQKKRKLDTLESNETAASTIKRTKTAITEQAGNSNKIVLDSVTDPTSLIDGMVDWPFSKFTEQLLHDLFDIHWEVRHGAAIGLRSVLKLHGKESGMRKTFSKDDELVAQHQSWVDDCTVRLLIIFALDQFVDYSTGQAVAPVRETCAQVLGAALQSSSCEGVCNVISVLLKLETRSETWEHRHSAFIGLRYVLAVRKELFPLLVKEHPQVLHVLTKGLQDESDDVRAVVAESLLSVVNQIPIYYPEFVIPVASALWDSLLTLDELSSAVAATLDVLAEFYATQENISVISRSNDTSLQLQNLIPRLWPFLKHPSPGVRTTTLLTFERLIGLNSTSARVWLPSILSTSLRLIFENILIEATPVPLKQAQTCWTRLVSLASDEAQSDLDFCLVETVIPCAKLFLTVLPGCEMHSSIYGKKEFDQSKMSSGISQDIDPETADFVSKSSSEMKALGALSLAELLNRLDLSGQTFQIALSFIESLLIDSSASNRYTALMILSAWKSIENSRCPGQLSSIGRCFELCLRNLEFSNEIQDWKELEALRFKLNEQLGIFAKASKLAIDMNLHPSQVLDTVKNLMSRVPPSNDLDLISTSIKTTIAIIQSMNISLNTSVSAAASQVLVHFNALPEKLGDVIKPLMSSIRKEESAILQDKTAAALGILMALVANRKPCPNGKIMKNILTLATDRLETRKISLTSQLQTVAKRGSMLALQRVFTQFGSTLFEELPWLLNLCTSSLEKVYASDVVTADMNEETEKSEEIFHQLQILGSLVKFVSEPLKSGVLLKFLDIVIRAVRHPDEILKEEAASVIVHFVREIPVNSMEVVIQNLLPMLEDASHEQTRAGASITIKILLDSIGLDILPYLAFLIVPLLGRLTDENDLVRRNANLAFANAVRLVPLEPGSGNPPGMSIELIDRKNNERQFLDQLLDSSKIKDFVIPVNIKAELRRYQQDGINWLAFLHRFNLHGILADDMGLGKTLQTLSVIVSDTFHRRNDKKERIPSIVICPSTLVHHWCYEIEKFFDRKDIFGIPYTGTSKERRMAQSEIFKTLGDNILVTSYSHLSSDIGFFHEFQYNYCVLDEGHVIKNTNTKMSQAVKSIKSYRRLILTGTPIQNNVVELWSLFDFLMPGYLGDHAFFLKNYSKPIMGSYTAKSNSKEQEDGFTALEALHKQVLPFILRRMKESVLADLPPKIIQDWYCDLSPLQIKLLETVSGKKEELKQEFEDITLKPEHDVSVKATASHVFQTIRYSLKVCSHPKLVLSSKDHPYYSQANAWLRGKNLTLSSLDIAPKLLALKQILQDSGIGTFETGMDRVKLENGPNAIASPAVGNHRLLIFAQFKGMLDIVASDLFDKIMPDVSYLRLDGSISSAQRFEIVRQFNEDPSIDVLLLTTSVGGLGLNLTGADTVVFLEHDWNPMKDLQAMDRAHRLGQKRVVNVYRLIMRDSLEEKIMSLQQFKTSVAQAVVSQENASLTSMDTDQVLDLFSVSSKRVDESIGAPGKTEESSVDEFGQPILKKGKSSSMKATIQSLTDMWDEKQYEDFNPVEFAKTLK